jgi:hypothetical protein
MTARLAMWTLETEPPKCDLARGRLYGELGEEKQNESTLAGDRAHLPPGVA